MSWRNACKSKCARKHDVGVDSLCMNSTQTLKPRKSSGCCGMAGTPPESYSCQGRLFREQLAPGVSERIFFEFGLGGASRGFAPARPRILDSKPYM